MRNLAPRRLGIAVLIAAPLLLSTSTRVHAQDYTSSLLPWAICTQEAREAFGECIAEDDGFFDRIRCGVIGLVTFFECYL